MNSAEDVDWRKSLHNLRRSDRKRNIRKKINVDIFEKYRRYVDKRLRVIAPDVLEKFISVYKRMNDEDPESKSQALLSCRRILKSVADSVYPATNKPIIGVDGKERILSDEKYVARLWQFVADKIEGKTVGKLLLARIEDLGNRIDKLYDLASKGIHADVSQDEVNQCVIQTYLIIGDIMHLAEES